jgi:hypothetical protein
LATVMVPPMCRSWSRHKSVRDIAVSVDHKSVRERAADHFVWIHARTVESWSAKAGTAGGRIRSVMRLGHEIVNPQVWQVYSSTTYWWLYLWVLAIMFFF